MKPYIAYDSEISAKNEVKDIGAVSSLGHTFHLNSMKEFSIFIKNTKFLVGHNSIHHDNKYLKSCFHRNHHFIDTLYLSPLVFPKRPYHHLIKDDKLLTDSLNNPLNDSKNASILFQEAYNAFFNLDQRFILILNGLLKDTEEFKGFFAYLDLPFKRVNVEELIKGFFQGRICATVSLKQYILKEPVALAYVLSMINAMNNELMPPWVFFNYPIVEEIIHKLRATACEPSCAYCSNLRSPKKMLKEFFDYDGFRLINGFNYQEEAVNAALDGKSILAVFPTGGGKSLTFQLPALISGRTEGGLTVIISPLQSLMKDQVDNLQQKFTINDAVTINGMLDPIERKRAIEMVEDGRAKLLYISPEMLRSKTIENLLMRRNVVRFVIDEAHCFSSWGQDFRVDYLYIADFINILIEAKSNNGRMKKTIPVSCFTATAKPKVIEDIEAYFKEKMNIELTPFIASSERKNLTYFVFEQNNSTEKFSKLVEIIDSNPGATIIYSSRTKQCEDLSRRLVDYGYTATFFHGQLDKKTKTENQEAFMNGQAMIMVATTAFGMGVDKSDVTTVIHYDISDSLENYVQEAGRAGRDEKLNAQCFVLFDEEDLNKHFMQLNQSKVSIKEIQQIWKAIKDLTKFRKSMTKSALEIAKAAGWDDLGDIETKVRTAINALEQRDFLKRKQNVPRLFANSLAVKSMDEAVSIIESSGMSDDYKLKAKRVVKSLITHKYTKEDKGDIAETRVDYLSDILEIPHDEMLEIIRHLKELAILENHNDFQAMFAKGDDSKKITSEINRHLLIERHLISLLDKEEVFINLKEQNELLLEQDNKVNINTLKNVILFLETERFISRRPAGQKNCYYAKLLVDREKLLIKSDEREKVMVSIVEYLFNNRPVESKANQEFLFSYKQIKTFFEHNLLNGTVDYTQIESALYFMKKTDCLKLEGAFAVLYNAMNIERHKEGSIGYKNEDYEMLDKFYKSKMEQIHIVGEYAKKMLESTEQALTFVNDYFTLEYDVFLDKYFKDEKRKELKESLTPKKFKQIFTDLNDVQKQVINHKASNYVVAAAGPGSGKTRVLVHKLASLCLLEDVKHEQLLMLTFSRAAATEFKERLLKLIGTTAHYIHITTFHSYCFDLLERVGSIENSANIVKEAVEKINNNEVDLSRITKTVLVIDEAQDMSEAEYNLVECLIKHNEELRVLAVGDDDQNIYEFRGSDSKYLRNLVDAYHATQFELLANYRSKANLIAFSNLFVTKIRNRMKANPIEAIRKENGVLSITNHCDTSLVIPVCNHVMNETLTGSVCILTLTNDLAVNITGYLLQNNIQAKLIQTNEGFSLLKLVEMAHFVSYLKEKSHNDLISEDLFDEAKASMITQFTESINLLSCVLLIDKYKQTSKAMFISEFCLFVHESSLENMDESNQRIYVSTIHQAKGKEFDNVFLCIGANTTLTEEVKRIVYVGITRAKDNLFIHDASNIFDEKLLTLSKQTYDADAYNEPSKISLYLTHRDVSLGGFKYGQRVLSKMKAGDALTVEGDACLFNGKKVLYFSNALKHRLEAFAEKGYKPTAGIARHMLYWSGRDEPENEIVICLPIIELEKETDA